MKMMGGGTDYNDYNDFPDAEQEEEEDEESAHQKKSNLVPVWGNEKTMNLNTLVLTNIQSSQYFKVKLYALKTYHEVLDEIYYQVSHLEPWEKGSRKTAGQTGMCGGVRGVGAGGIVSTAYCILYKLFTLRLTRKQLNGCLNNADSPYIRGLGLMYIRYTQPPADLWTWLEPYLDDEEELDVRAGGGQSITIGAMCRHLMTKLDWHSTLFPRIPVPIQKDIEKKIQARDGQATDAAIKERLQQAPVRGWKEQGGGGGGGAAGGGGGGRSHGQSPIASSNGRALSRDRHDSKDRRDPVSKDRSRHTSRDRDPPPSRDRLSRDREPRPRDLDRDRRSKDMDRDGRSKDMDRDGRSRDMDRDRRSRDTDRDRRSRDRLDRRSRDRDGHSKVRGRGSRDRERSPRNRDRHRERSRDRAVRKDHHRRDRERRDLETSSRRRSRDKDSRDKHKRDRRDREKDSRRHHRSRSGSFQDFSADLQREKERIKSRPRSRSRSRDRDRKYR